MTTSIQTGRLGAGLVAAICLALGACNARDASDGSLESSVPAFPSSQMQAFASPSTMVPIDAVASLPDEGGPVASVRGHAYVDGFRQDILLKSTGLRGVENGITVLVRTSQQQTLDERVPLFKPTEAAIRSEMGRAFPHIGMQVVERTSSNTYGVYGLALGRPNDKTRCVYMWQWIDSGSLPRDMSGPASVRVRLCKADTTFDALASLLDHLTIRPDANAGRVSVAIVDPPVDLAPSRHTTHAKHRAHRIVAARRDAPAVDVTAPASATPVAYAPTAAPPPTVDLPPQAFLGPTARSLKQN